VERLKIYSLAKELKVEDFGFLALGFRVQILRIEGRGTSGILVDFEIFKI